ncbi:hypothetical protein C8Q72DRAFT_809190 [Fomitopsis betulina]|nr:hypothetical protein C8Q72DRAFT_809190 [Fomitopsis betulina]
MIHVDTRATPHITSMCTTRLDALYYNAIQPRFPYNNRHKRTRMNTLVQLIQLDLAQEEVRQVPTLQSFEIDVSELQVFRIDVPALELVELHRTSHDLLRKLGVPPSQRVGQSREVHCRAEHVKAVVESRPGGGPDFLRLGRWGLLLLPRGAQGRLHLCLRLLECSRWRLLLPDGLHLLPDRLLLGGRRFADRLHFLPDRLLGGRCFPDHLLNGSLHPTALELVLRDTTQEACDELLILTRVEQQGGLYSDRCSLECGAQAVLRTREVFVPIDLLGRLLGCGLHSSDYALKAGGWRLRLRLQPSGRALKAGGRLLLGCGLQSSDDALKAGRRRRFLLPEGQSAAAIQCEIRNGSGEARGCDRERKDDSEEGAEEHGRK